MHRHLVAFTFALCLLSGLAVAANDALMPLSEWDHIARALVASYVEGDAEAGFGEYPLYLAGKPDLYTTYSSILITHLLAPSELDADALAEGINALQTQRGGFVDPEINYAPEWWQTRWACWSLGVLDRTPTDPAALLDFLLSFRQESELFQYDPEHSSVPDMERDSADVAILLMSPFFESLPGAEHALSDLADYARANLSILINTEPTPMTVWGFDNEERKVWGLLQLVCLLLPDQVPEPVRAILRLAIENPPPGGGDFLVASNYYSLIQRARALSPALEFDDRPLLNYLENEFEPVLEPLGGFGEGAWIDPAMTWGVVGLYHEAGIPYPFKTSCLQFLDRYAHPQGWIPIIHVFPKPLSTWQGVKLSRYGGIDVADEGKLLAYGETVLADPESDLEDLYYATLIVESVASSANAAIDILRNRIESTSPSDLEHQADLLVQIFNAFPQALVENARTALLFHLQLCADNLDRLDVERFWEVTLLQPLLGVETIPEEVLLSKLVGLAYGGGFRSSTDVPAPSLWSTQLAVDCLVRLNALDSEAQEMARQFVEACRTKIGYLQRPPAYIPSDAQKEFLMFALEAMEILSLLDEWESSLGSS